MAPALPNKPLLPESQRKRAGASRVSPRTRPSAESSSPRHGVRGPVTIKVTVKRSSEALPFHVVKGEGRSGEKQNPREAAGLPTPAAASHGTVRWGGWGGSRHRLCIAPSSPARPIEMGPKGSRDHVFCIRVGLANKTKASGGEGGCCHSSPPSGAEPLAAAAAAGSKHLLGSTGPNPALLQQSHPALGSHRSVRVPSHAGGTCP